MDQKEQKSKTLEEKAKSVETFNPHWNAGEFLGPNTFRQEEKTEKYEEGES